MFGNALRESYPEQFHTRKSMFTALVSFTISNSYRISQGSTKDEDLKELCRNLIIKIAYLLTR